MHAFDRQPALSDRFVCRGLGVVPRHAKPFESSNLLLLAERLEERA